MKKKIAFLMHIHWHWIKQRPQFIAEKLTKDYDVDVYFVSNIKDYKVTSKIRNKTILNFKRIIKIPFSAKFRLLSYLEKFINKRIIDNISQKNYDYIWITSPVILHFADIHKFSKSTIIYDCMDDIYEFTTNKNNHVLKKMESELFYFSNIILVSSRYLLHKVTERMPEAAASRVFLVNNALDVNQAHLSSLEEGAPETNEKKRFNIVYFGMIADWFDFETLKDVLDRYPDIQFTLIGPLEVKPFKHDRIIYTGSVNHEAINLWAESADAFIMPFKLNELIKSVDPVKMYEYIQFNKPVFCIHYEEVMKFQPFVYLYKDSEELSLQIAEVRKKNTGISQESIRTFLNENNWDKRVEQIRGIIETAGSN